MKKAMTPAESVQRLEALCARSEQCSSDIRAKLYKWGIASDTAQEIIDGLVDRKFVDDNRFARAYVRDKYRFSRWGRRKITAALIAKRMSRATIAEALTEIDPKEYAANAYRTVAAKLRTLDTGTPRREIKAKLMQHALGRGYEPSIIYRILDSHRLWDSSTV